MKPAFSVVNLHYPTRADFPIARLYESIGWEDLTNDMRYRNTCATRLSIALIRSRVPLTGRMRIRKGDLKGKAMEPGQARLSEQLKTLWGRPEVYRSGREETAKAIGKRSGVVSFFRIEGQGSEQGHIDIISSTNGYYRCAMSCYFDAVEIWFWPLD